VRAIKAIGMSASEGRTEERVVVKRLGAYSVIILAYLVGGGSLLLFGAFLVVGPFAFIHFPLSEGQALILDGLLSFVFFAQHSGMVRTSFRTRFSSVVPNPYHPAIYSIASGSALTAAVLLWQPSATVFVQIQGPLQWLFRAISLLAIAGFVWGVRALGAFDPFGLASIILHLRGRELRPPNFVLRGPYLWVRHPLYFFMLVLVWSFPHVNADRLLFNVLWSGWIVVGSYLEERDLAAEFGEKYRRYQKTVPMLIPWKGPNFAFRQ
jgi:methanethiol S-methyltransferase